MFYQRDKVSHLFAFQAYHLLFNGALIKMAFCIFRHSLPNNLRLGFEQDQPSYESRHGLFIVRFVRIETVKQLLNQ